MIIFFENTPVNISNISLTIFKPNCCSKAQFLSLKKVFFNKNENVEDLPICYKYKLFLVENLNYLLKGVLVKTSRKFCRSGHDFIDLAYVLLFFEECIELSELQFQPKVRRPVNYLEDYDWYSKDTMYPGYMSERKVIRKFLNGRKNYITERFISFDYDSNKNIGYLLADNLYKFNFKGLIPN